MKSLSDLAYKAAHCYVNIHEKFWFKYILSFFLFGIPFFLLDLCTNAGLRDFLKEKSTSEVKDFFDSNFWWFYLATAAISFLGTRLYSLANYLDKKSIFSDVNIASLNIVWEQLVDNKRNRFDQLLTSKKYTKQMSKEDIFNEITRPDQQFLAIAQLLHDYFHNSFKHAYKVRILQIENKKAYQWLAATPPGPVTDCAKLNEPKSTISHCIKKKKMIIIENIADEIQKNDSHYFITHDIKEEKGSLICIPCYCEKKRDFATIVIIWCDEKYFFKERERGRIETITKQIEARIKLEQNLYILTE